MESTHPNTYFSSFEGLKPFLANGSPRNNLFFYDWPESETRRALIAQDKHMTKDAFWFYTDQGLTLEEVKNRLGDIEIFSDEEALSRFFDPFEKKRDRKIKETADRVQQAFIKISKKPPIVLPATYTLDTNESFKFSSFKALMHFVNNGIPCPYTFFCKIETKTNEGWVALHKGSFRYALNDLQDRPGRGYSPHRDYEKACERSGLSYFKNPYLIPVRPFTPASAESVFGYSVSGGARCVRVVVNVAEGKIVPLDSHLDIATHKHGWSYLHKYFGRYGTGLSCVMMSYHEPSAELFIDEPFAVSLEIKRKANIMMAQIAVMNGIPANTIMKPVKTVDDEFNPPTVGEYAQLRVVS